jgi:hypothetical protein
MKAPVPCLRCKTYSMEMDMSKDHQHIQCQNCAAMWCLICTTVEVDPEWLRQVQAVGQAASKAHLN